MSLLGYHIRMDDILPEDIVLSMTIDDKTGFVNALIHGCTAGDTEMFSDWLQTLLPEIFDPLLLPALVMELVRTKHSEMMKDKVAKLLQLSGATRLYDRRLQTSLDDVDNYNQKTKEVLQLHQETGDLALALAQTRVQVMKLLEHVTQEEVTRADATQFLSASTLKQRLRDILEVYEHLERTCAQVTRDSNLLMGAVSAQPYLCSRVRNFPSNCH
jgi:hypothetical protein